MWKANRTAWCPRRAGATRRAAALIERVALMGGLAAVIAVAGCAAPNRAQPVSVTTQTFYRSTATPLYAGTTSRSALRPAPSKGACETAAERLSRERKDALFRQFASQEGVSAPSAESASQPFGSLAAAAADPTDDALQPCAPLR